MDSAGEDNKEIDNEFNPANKLDTTNKTQDDELEGIITSIYISSSQMETMIITRMFLHPKPINTKRAMMITHIQVFNYRISI
jgi:hypothetical protein